MEGQVILAGDFNQVMDRMIDKSKPSGESSPRDRAAIQMLAEDLCLVDIQTLVKPILNTCHCINVTSFNFTWIPSGMKYLGIQFNPNLEEVMFSNMEPLLQKIKMNSMEKK